MTDNVKGFIVLRDFSAGIGLLSTLQKGQLMEALFADMEGAAMPALDPVTNAVFQMMLPSVHAAQNAFSKKQDTARENGARGGRPKKTETNLETKKPDENPKTNSVSEKPDENPKTNSVSEKPRENPKTDSVSENLNRIDKNRIDKNRNIKTDTSYLAQSDACASSAQPPEVEHEEPAVAHIPLSDGTNFAVPESLAQEYAAAYPGVNVLGELAKARAWCLSNPKQRKTRSGIRRFLNSWMDRAQNNATRASPAARAGRPMTARQMEAEERGDFATQILKFDEAMKNGRLEDYSSGTRQDICALSSAEARSRRI